MTESGGTDMDQPKDTRLNEADAKPAVQAGDVESQGMYVAADVELPEEVRAAVDEQTVTAVELASAEAAGAANEAALAEAAASTSPAGATAAEPKAESTSPSAPVAPSVVPVAGTTTQGAKSRQAAAKKPRVRVGVAGARPARGTSRSGSKPGTRAAARSAAESEVIEEERNDTRKGALFLGCVVLVYIVYLVLSGQMFQFVDALSKVNLTWVWWACFCFILYFIFGVGAYVVAVWLDHDSPVGIRDLMSVEASGIFFGNLTPMMAGAVPAQILRLTRTGLDPGEAAATQFTRFIMFQFGVVLFAAIMLLAKFRFFLESYGDIVFLNLVVFGVHFAELLGLFVVCLAPNFVKRVGNAAISFLSRHNWLKDREHWDEVVNVQVDEFSQAFLRAAKHLPSMFVTLVVTMLQLASLYMIPWFVLRAFGIKGDFVECLAAGSMVQMVATAVPLPGGTGGAEGGFMLFYGKLFGSSATAGFLIWRIVTFFLPTFLSVPLLGLRSNTRVSIYHRTQQFLARLGLVPQPTGPIPQVRRHSANGVSAKVKPRKK